MRIREMLIAYLKLFAIIVALILGCYIANSIDFGPNSLDSAGIILYLIIACPVIIIVYGVLSYKLTKQVVFPNLFLWLILFIAISIATIIHSGTDGFFNKFIGAFYLSVVVTAVSFIFSLITKLINKKRKK